MRACKAVCATACAAESRGFRGTPSRPAAAWALLLEKTTFMRKQASITLVLALATLAACSSAPSDQPADDGAPQGKADAGITTPPTGPVATEVRLQFQPGKGFSGFDGTHAYTFPIAVYGAKDTPTLAASDPSMADIVPAKLAKLDPELPDDGVYFLVTAKKAGSFELVATSQGTSIKAPATVVTYDAARYAAGEQRYKMGTAAGTGTGRPCTECHNDTAGAPDHSPAALAGVEDAKVENVIRSGLLASGFPIRTSSGVQHTWDASDAEMKGLVTYLRALPQTKVIKK